VIPALLCVTAILLLGCVAVLPDRWQVPGLIFLLAIFATGMLAGALSAR
jgi:hypothetical protein